MSIEKGTEILTYGVVWRVDEMVGDHVVKCSRTENGEEKTAVFSRHRLLEEMGLRPTQAENEYDVFGVLDSEG